MEPMAELVATVRLQTKAMEPLLNGKPLCHTRTVCFLFIYFRLKQPKERIEG
jgi:hypothetical protein